MSDNIRVFSSENVGVFLLFTFRTQLFERFLNCKGISFQTYCSNCGERTCSNALLTSSLKSSRNYHSWRGCVASKTSTLGGSALQTRVCLFNPCVLKWQLRIGRMPGQILISLHYFAALIQRKKKNLVASTKYDELYENPGKIRRFAKVEMQM